MDYPFKLKKWYENGTEIPIGTFVEFEMAETLASLLDTDAKHPEDGFFIIGAPEGRYLLGHQQRDRVHNAFSESNLPKSDARRWIGQKWYGPGETAFYYDKDERLHTIHEAY